MSWSFVVLCLATAFLLALTVSGLVGLTIPLWERLARTIPPRRETTFWIGLGLLPLVAAVFLVAVSMLPSAGVGADHCLLHDPHHPHLCFRHGNEVPGVVLRFLALFVFGRGVAGLFGLLRGICLGARTSRNLAEASDVDGDMLIFESSEVQAFVLGTLWPRLHVSSALLSLDDEVVAPVLAHERAHIRHRDLFWRTLFPLLALGHLPGVARRLGRRLVTSQEIAADLDAARTVGSPIMVAEAILAMRTVYSGPAYGLSFNDGNTAARVRRLLELSPTSRGRPMELCAIAGLSALVVAVAFHDSIHHALESLLGLLS